MVILDGKKLALKIEKNLASAIHKNKLKPGLAVILIGRDLSSRIYVALKEKAAQRIGINFFRFDFTTKISQKKIINLIQKLNHNKKINGIIVQVPLPKHLNPDKIVAAIDSKKDVDGFKSDSYFVSPTHQAVLELLRSSKQNLKNKKTIILAKSLIFASPLKNLLEQKGARVEIKLIKEKNYLAAMRKADIVIVAIGQPHFVKPAMIKKDATVIDVGYNRFRNKPAGDVDPRVAQKVCHLSPVPGGVGPLTVVFLLKNVYLSAKLDKIKKGDKIIN